MSQLTLQVMPNKMVKAGDVIFSEGDLPHEGLYYVCYGTAELTRKEKDGAVRTLAEFSEGQVFGEMGVINSAPRTANAIAKTDCGFYTISIDQFQHKTDQLDPLMRGVFRVFVLTIRDFMQQKEKWLSAPKETDLVVGSAAMADEERTGPLVEGFEQKMKQ